MDPDRVFTRQDLLNRVWGTDAIVDDRTVDVHISWLRGKLARAGIERSPIQTAYGSGYRFNSALATAALYSESNRPDGGAVQTVQANRLDRAG
jgi:DNA-binding winged helix-turn-helix (wHTH) protein